MKTTRLKIATLAALGALALAPSASFAATNTAYQPFGATVMSNGTGNQCNSSGGGAVWQNWFVNFGGTTGNGITNYQIIFDTTAVPTPNPTGVTGSMKQVQSWDGTNAGTLSTFACIDGDFWGGQKVNMSQFEAIELDFRFDTTSDMAPTNDCGVNIGVNANNNGSSVPINTTGIFNTGTGATNFDGAWHHLSIPIPVATTAFNSEGPGFQIFHPASATRGTFSYWIANITLIARTIIPLPPAMTINPIGATSYGLRQFADAAPDYARQDIRTDTTSPGSKNVDWVGHPNATYSWTITDFPGPGFAGFQAAATFTPDPPENMAYADPDWSATNALWVRIQSENNGSVTAIVRCKTNSAGNNAQMFGAGTGALGTNSLNVPSAIGTWSVTFPNNTSLTLTAPNGASTNVVLDASFGDASSYTNISFFFYTSGANTANIGKSAIITSLSAANVVNAFNENLTDGVLNTPFLRLQSQGYANANLNPVNQVFVTSADAYWLHWTLPAPQFNLVTKSTLDTNVLWQDFSPTPILNNDGSNIVRVPKASLPGGANAFFALQQRTNFTQLLVLFPGETNAPNTLTGKVGTPTNVSLGAGGATDFTVRAVDPNWNLISTTDTIRVLTSTDTLATLPADTAMVGGIATFTGINNLVFATLGAQTITVTNMSRVMPLSTNAPPVNVVP